MYTLEVEHHEVNPEQGEKAANPKISSVTFLP